MNDEAPSRLVQLGGSMGRVEPVLELRKILLIERQVCTEDSFLHEGRLFADLLHYGFEGHGTRRSLSQPNPASHNPTPTQASLHGPLCAPAPLPPCLSDCKTPLIAVCLFVFQMGFAKLEEIFQIRKKQIF